MGAERAGGGYMLCASPRSGSTLLCDLLDRTGRAGAPASYLRPASIVEFATEWEVDTDAENWGETYLSAVRQRSAGDSGCPALRIMWSDMATVLDRLRAIDPERSSDRARLRHLLGVEHYIHLRRDDRIAQAVSLVLADQTGVWHLNTDGSPREVAPGGGEPVYDRHRIETEVQKLAAEADGWQAWFESQSISPIRLAYEDLAERPGETVREVMAAIGRPVRGSVPDAGTARLAADVNDRWVDRFRRETRR